MVAQHALRRVILAGIMDSRKYAYRTVFSEHKTAEFGALLPKYELEIISSLSKRLFRWPG